MVNSTSDAQAWLASYSSAFRALRERVCIYIYVRGRERERERETDQTLSLKMYFYPSQFGGSLFHEVPDQNYLTTSISNSKLAGWQGPATQSLKASKHPKTGGPSALMAAIAFCRSAADACSADFANFKASLRPSLLFTPLFQRMPWMVACTAETSEAWSATPHTLYEGPIHS